MAQGYDGRGPTSRQGGTQASAMARLAAGVAHEINNPVGVLMLKLKFLLSVADAEGLSERAVATLRVAVEQTERIERIVERLAAFSQPAAGPSGRVGARTACERARTRIESGRGPGEAPGLSWELADDLPDLRADPEDLGLILANLVDNAIHAAGAQGRVTVRARAVELQSGAFGLELSVTDDGPGIPADYVEHIFDPFFTTKRSGEGTGLGLAVVRNRVTALGGSVHVDSRRGQGTTLRVVLPAVRAA